MHGGLRCFVLQHLPKAEYVYLLMVFADITVHLGTTCTAASAVKDLLLSDRRQHQLDHGVCCLIVPDPDEKLVACFMHPDCPD